MRGVDEMMAEVTEDLAVPRDDTVNANATVIVIHSADVTAR